MCGPFLSQDCCSELEALGAGAPHVHTRQEKEEQIERDVSRTSYIIGSITIGPSTGQDIQDNIQQKLVQREGERECVCTMCVCLSENGERKESMASVDTLLVVVPRY